MKRSKYLETLSFEHHDGLVIAAKIKNDLKKEKEPTHLIDYVIDVYESGLLHHFHQEEKGFAAVMQSIAIAEPFMSRMEIEHKQFSKIIKNIRKSGTNVFEQIRMFGELLHDHIRFEERELFPFIECSLTVDQLKALGVYLHREHQPLHKLCQI